MHYDKMIDLRSAARASPYTPISSESPSSDHHHHHHHHHQWQMFIHK